MASAKLNQLISPQGLHFSPHSTFNIMNKLQETTFFSWVLEIDFHYETKARKVIVDFKFDALNS